MHPPWGKQILRDPCKFTVKPHFPAPPLDPPWGKQILRAPCEFTVKTHFPAPPLHPPWGKQILSDPCKFTVKPHFPAPPLDPLWEMQSVHFTIWFQCVTLCEWCAMLYYVVLCYAVENYVVLCYAVECGLSCEVWGEVFLPAGWSTKTRTTLRMWGIKKGCRAWTIFLLIYCSILIKVH